MKDHILGKNPFSVTFATKLLLPNWEYSCMKNGIMLKSSKKITWIIQHTKKLICLPTYSKYKHSVQISVFWKIFSKVNHCHLLCDWKKWKLMQFNKWNFTNPENLNIFVKMSSFLEKKEFTVWKLTTPQYPVVAP